MSKKDTRRKLKDFNTCSAMERRRALEQGTVWVRPTISMEMRSRYNRNRQKRAVRKEVMMV